MSGRVGSITTDIVKDGLVLNTDASNRASTIPSTCTTKVYNTVDTSIEGTFQDNAQFTTSGSIKTWQFDGVDDFVELPFIFNPDEDFTISFWFKRGWNL